MLREKTHTTASWRFVIKTGDLVEFSSDPAFSVDDDLRVIGWNTAAAKLLGHSAAEVLGKKCGQVLQAFYPTGEPLCSVLCEGCSCIAVGEKWSMGACQIRHESGEMIDAAISTLVLPHEVRESGEGDAAAIIFLRKVNSAADSEEPDLPMRVFTLGRFGLALAGHGLDVGSWKRKQAAVVLKCLASQIGRPVHRERLIEWLWPNSDPERGWQRLKVAISFLRGVLREGGARPDTIETIGQSYLLRRDAVWLDSEEFCTLVAAGWKTLNDGGWSQAQERFEEAESLYRGDYFEVDVDIDDFQVYAAGYDGSIDVIGGRWEVCEDRHYRGRCTVIEGRYDNLDRLGFAAGIGSIRHLN